MPAQRVCGTQLHAALLIRLIQRREQQHQKRHVICQRQAAGKAVALLEHPAQPTVAALIAILLRLGQALEICDHISKHRPPPQVLRWKDVPHLRHTQARPARGAFKKAVVTPLMPAVDRAAPRACHLVALAKIRAVFLLAAVDIARKHPEIGHDQTEHGQRPQNARCVSMHEHADAQQDQRQHGQEAVERVHSVSAHHPFCKPLSHDRSPFQAAEFHCCILSHAYEKYIKEL